MTIDIRPMLHRKESMNKKMKQLLRTGITFLLALALSMQTLTAQVDEGVSLQATLQEMAQTAVQESKLPAIFLSTLSGEQEPVVAAAGVRALQQEPGVTPNDLVHIGSCTKAFTAVLIARLVEAGHLKWDQTIAETWPELKDQIHADYHDRTLLQLLQHQANLPANAKNWWLQAPGTIQEQRIAIMLDSLGVKAPRASRNGYRYSNLGYMVAGCMAERVMAEDWETLVVDQVCQPLGLSSVGFGPPGSEDQIDQPRGHIRNAEGQAISNYIDNAPPLGPAGRMHLTVADWARFSTLFHADSKQTLLSRESLVLIETPATGTDYGLGWSIAERSWGNGRVLTHAGSNTTWMAIIWIAPKTNRTFIAVSNAAGGQTPQILDRLISKMIQLDQKR
jgi:CubicO group peptidase (beta-lactamase class C family)